MKVGGQAVIEGVMMKTQDKRAVAVRKPNGEIEVSVDNIVSYTKKYKIFSLPFIRGAVSMIESIVEGINILTYSASFYEEDDEKGKVEKFLDEKFKGNADKIVMGFTVLTSFLMAILLFVVLPTLTANFLKFNIKNTVYINLLEGLIRLLVFLAYIYLISKMDDIERMFQYHGAEHKAVFCYEANLPLNVENVSKFSTLHPRCGTNFMLIVMLISIFIFSFLGWPNIFLRLLSRILLIPVVAGVSYEILRWFGNSNSKLAKFISYPGLMLQKLTTREPDEKQMEVAIKALNAVLGEE